MTPEKGTSERLYEHYHTYTGRPSLHDTRTRRFVFKAFLRTLGPLVPPDRGARVLDIACGEGALLAFLRERGYTNLAGFDISPENVGRCHDLGLTFVREFDARQLKSWPDRERYDIIFALDLIEHMPKQAAAGFLEDVRLLLRPGGCTIIQTPNMGSVAACFHRYADLSHEFGLTERTAVDLMTVAGFARERIEVWPSWNATTLAGRLRELYVRLLHAVFFLAEGSGRPEIPTKNLLIRAFRE